jgi:hypothetical protein
VTGSLPPPFVAVTSWVPSVAHVHSPPGLPSASGPASAEQDLLALSDILRPSMAAAAVCTTEALNDARWKAKCPEVGAEQIQRIVHAVVADEGWRTDQGDRTHGRLSDGPHGRHGTAAAGSLRHCRGRASRPNCATRSRTGPRSFRMRAAISTPSPTPCTKSRAGNGRRTVDDTGACSRSDGVAELGPGRISGLRATWSCVRSGHGERSCRSVRGDLDLERRVQLSLS